MSLRTYPLITHPAYKELVASSLLLGKPPEKVDALHAHFSVPPLKDVREIGNYLGVSQEAIWSVQMLRERAYREFPITKRSGKTRMIHAPRTHLKVIQWWILDTIVPSIPISEHAYGFVRGKSFVDNARVHLGANHVLNLDIEDFFPSISPLLVANVFSALGYDPNVVLGLVKLTTLGASLPQGAPTSPALANAVCLSIDEQLQRLSQSNGITYSRYADDLTFSSSNRIPESIISAVSAILSDFGLKLNGEKTRFMGVNQQKEVTGLILGEDNVCLKRSDLNAARGWFHSISMRPREHLLELERVRGTVAMIKSVGGRGSSKVIAKGDRALSALLGEL